MHWSYQIRRHFVFLRHLFWDAYRERMLLTVVTTVVFGSLIAIANWATYPTLFWDQYKSGMEVNTAFCEWTDMHRLIRQPINTFTNFVYLILAIYTFTKGMEDIRRKRAYNLITANRFYSFALSGIAFYTFLSSTFYHASLIDYAQIMDFSAVYSIALFPLMCLTHRMTLYFRRKPSSQQNDMVRFVMIGLFTLFYFYLTYVLDFKYIHETVAVLVTLIILFATYLEIREPGHANRDYLVATGVSIILAGIFFEMDARRILCDPNGVSPHSLWHLFNGFSIFSIYIYIRSEHYDHSRDALRNGLKERAHLHIMDVIKNKQD
jgi:Ceramidase